MVKIIPVQFDETSQQISNLSETRHVLQSTGNYDLVAVVKACNLEHLNDLRKKVEMIPALGEFSFSVATRLIKINASFYL